MSIYQQQFVEFNQEFKLPRPITPQIFTTSIHRAIDLIESALGSGHSVVEYLRREPPIPMFDREGGQRHFGRIIASENFAEHSKIEVRPDLVFYPLIMISVLIHEATHALDPHICDAAIIANELLLCSTVDDPDNQNKFYNWKESEAAAELRAVTAEIEVLPNIVLPQGFLPEQKQYFTSQRAAVLAMRVVESAHIEAVIALLQFSKYVNQFAGNSSEILSETVIERTQELLNFLLQKGGKGVNWADSTANRFNSIRSDMKSFSIDDYNVGELLQNTAHKLEMCRVKHNQNVWLASKARLPPLG